MQLSKQKVMPIIQTAIKGVSAGVKARGTGGNQLFVYFGDKRDANNPNNFVFAIDFETNAMVAFIGSIEDNQVDGFSLWNQTDVISLINEWEEDNPSLVNEIENISYLNSELFDIRRNITSNKKVQSSLKGGNMRRRKVQASITPKELTQLAIDCGGSVGDTSMQVIFDEIQITVTSPTTVLVENLNTLDSKEFKRSEQRLLEKWVSANSEDRDTVANVGEFMTALSEVQSSLKGGNMKVLSRAQAQRKLLALAGIRKVTQSLIALAEADEGEQDNLQEEVQDAVEELLENPSDDIEEAIEDITSAMKRNHRVVSGEDDAFYDEDIVDLSEADEDEDMEDDVVESRFRSRKVQSRMQRKRNVMAELDEEFDGAYTDDITDESDLDEDIYDEDSYEEVSSSRRKGRKVGAKTRTSVKSSKTKGKRKATASIVAANLAALRNM